MKFIDFISAARVETRASYENKRSVLNALAGLLAERTCVIDLSLEGKMLFAAFAAAAAASASHSTGMGLMAAIAVACAATGLVGKESDLFRFTLKHSLFFAFLVGLITMAQAYWLTWMIP